MFHTVLIANRGEIAVRAIKTLKKLGIKSIAVYSETDRYAQHVTDADVAISLDGIKPSDTYLNIEKLIAAAKQTDAQAIFPGYGFLSESADFSRACEENDIAFMGPTAEQILEFGLKHRARELAANANVPMTPGTGLLDSLDEAVQEAARIGYPIMLKSTAGGGGIGLTRCDDEPSLREAYESVKRLGEQFFKDAGVFIECFIDQARHVEVQIFGDGQGNVVAFGERDCSLQRRNQKVVEETPAPNLPEATRKRLHQSAIALGESVNYRSAGTVEYIYDAKRDEFYFLEVNTRLQVEHPVTEMVTGLDLIECMLKVAAGDDLDWEKLKNIQPKGAAIEVRVYAENPIQNFQPSPGTLTEVYFPETARIDTWVKTGTEVSQYFDPMIAKIIVYAEDRQAAIAKLDNALAQTRLEGINTNIDYARHVIADQRFIDAKMWTRMLDEFCYQANVIEVIQAGMQSSIQDYPGRVGYWNIGVPPSGPMDDYAFRLGNQIVGNDPRCAGIEFTLQAPTLKFHAPATIALTGAMTEATLNGKPIPFWQPIEINAGQILALGKTENGCRSYLAIRNGLDVPEYLGSRATFALGNFGGHAGRTLKAGDILKMVTAEQTNLPLAVNTPQAIDQDTIPSYGTHWNIGVLSGPHGAPDFFNEDYLEEFFAATWKVHFNSNRLGVRLVGPKPSWTRENGGEAGLHPSNVHDCEYAIGAINFTGDFPVIIGKDGPSLGGFVCPLTIAKAELWKVGQLRPDDSIRFFPITVEQANALEIAQIKTINMLSQDIVIVEPNTQANTAKVPSAILYQAAANAAHPSTVYRQAGDSYILIEYGDNVLDLALRLRVYQLMQVLEQQQPQGVLELSPGVRSLQIKYDSLVLPQPDLIALLLEIEKSLGDASTLKVPSRIVHLPMAFEDSATLGAVERYQQSVCQDAPWLPNNVDFIQRINGLSTRQEVEDIVFDANYLVLGLGDVYLTAPCAVPIDPRHRLLSSKYNPARTFTAEGTVGIGGMYMCIYGMDSPGGYQLIGRTVPIWNKFKKNKMFGDQQWFLRFFDQIKYFKVSEEELNQWRADFEQGLVSVKIEETEFDFAEHLAFLEQEKDSIDQFKAQQKQAFDTEVSLWTNQTGIAEETDHAIDLNAYKDDTAVNASMTGNVWKILVEEGQQINIGDTVAILEAMKMELAITSASAGIVKAIVCHQGQTIFNGDPLIYLQAS